MGRGRNRQNNRSGGTVSVGIIVLAFMVIMTIQIINLKGRDNSYAQRIQDLQKEYQEQVERATEIDALEEYMKSEAFIEETAKSKLGLAYDNETIYKESED